MTNMVDEPDFAPINLLRRLEWPSRASLIVRHAERYPLPSALDHHHIGLTEKGKGDAQGFGRLLGAYQGIRLFHSPAKRCRETAQAMAEGADRIGVEVITTKEDPGLSWTTCVLNDRCLVMVERMGYDFIREWFSGRVDQQLIRSAAVTSSEMAQHLVHRLDEDGRAGVLDINVSHDWNILALRELLDRRQESDGWIGFLEGLALYPTNGSISLADGNTSRSIRTVGRPHRSGDRSFHFHD